MKRRDFIILVGGAAASWPLAVRAQQPSTPVIGVLTAGHLDKDFLEPFLQGLSESGYVEGHSVTIVYRPADDQFDRLPELAADLVGRKISVIVAMGSPVPARAAMAATKTIPVVFAYGGDPVGDKLVSSFNQPGGNVTGATFIGTTVTAKRLELLQEIAPWATEIALLSNPGSTLAETQIRDLEAAALILGQHLHVVNASNEAEIDAAFAIISQMKAGAVFVTTDPIFGAHRAQLAALATRYKIPAIYSNRDYSLAGGLMSYGGSRADAWHQAGIYTGRILKGEKPADLPVVQPTKFELVINLKTAKALGISVPPKLLAVADEVIE
jgi:putative tryptophan/tyrosine transport system substrate-binding protein